MNFLTTESTEDTEKEEESGSLYPNNLKNWVFGCAKAPGIDDRKSVHISNIDRLTIVDSRELSRGPKPNFSGCLGITGKSMGAAIDIHRALGPGLLESAYGACLIYELRLRKLKVESQKSMPIFYKDVMLDCGYRVDLIVED